MDDDIIGKLLQTTGLSCDDLLNKLQSYKKIADTESDITEYLKKDVDNENGIKNPTICNDNSMILTPKFSLIEGKVNNSSTVSTLTKNVLEDISDIPNALSIDSFNEMTKSTNLNTCNLFNDNSTINTAELPIIVTSSHDSTTSLLKSSVSKRNVTTLLLKSDSDNLREKYRLYLEDHKIENNPSVSTKVNTNLAAEREEDFTLRVTGIKKTYSKMSPLKIDNLNFFNDKPIDKDNELELSDKVCVATLLQDDNTNGSKEKIATVLSTSVTESNIKLIKSDKISILSNEDGKVLLISTENDLKNVVDDPTAVSQNKSDQIFNFPKTKSVSLEITSNMQKLESEEDSSSNLSKPDSRNETMNELFDSEASNSSITNPDELRDVLRKQLSSLRNMKKSTNFLSEITTKTVGIDRLQMRKKRKSIDMKIVPQSTNEDVQSDESPLISLSTETNFVILDVKGGVGLPSEESSSTAMDQTISSPKKGQLVIRNDIGSNIDCSDPGRTFLVQKVTENSPFVSDTLNDFLNESSQLKISYAIPKCGAEDGLTEANKVEQYDKFFDSAVTAGNYKTEEPVEEKDTEKAPPLLSKPKTLAEKRRQYEKLAKSKKTNKVTSKIKSTKPILISNPFQRNGYFMFNENKLNVTTRNTSDDKIIVGSCKTKTRNVISKPRKGRKVNKTFEFVPVGKRKPSLLATLAQQKFRSSVAYKPGPLSKKNLKVLPNGWISLTKKLPQIFLDVTPEINKRLDPKIVHHLDFMKSEIISEERSIFALSMLTLKEPQLPNTFQVPIKYQHNQVQMLVRQRKPVKRKLPEEQPTEDAITKGVKSVVEGLLNYVNVKELEPSLVKDDIIEVEDEKLRSPQVKRRKNRISMELSRLNCKIIDVAADDDGTCTKPHCRLGCICSSLQCTARYSDHCQELQCMFQCKCAAHSAKDIHSSNHSLGARQASLLDEHAKRNLAKVEQDFTQTVIHTNNDVIFVGKQPRRAGKAPKRYSDYLTGTATREKSAVRQLKALECCIPLERLDCSSLVPLCLQHGVYDCICTVSVNEKAPKPKGSKRADKKANKKADKKVDSEVDDKNDDKAEELCARLRQVFPYYLERNRHPYYQAQLKRFARIKHMPEPIKSKLKEFDSSAAIIIDDDDEPLSNRKPIKKSTSKRKQALEIRDDSMVLLKSGDEQTFGEELFVRNKRKQMLKVREEAPLIEEDPLKMLPLPPLTPIPKVVVADNLSRAMQRRRSAAQYKRIFDGEIKLDLRENADLLKIIGTENASLDFLRILPWKNLVKGFQEETIGIWAKNTKSSPLLCDVGSRNSPKNYACISEVEERSDLVNWILDGRLPDDKPEENMHVILIPRKKHFLISGLCMKKIEPKRLRLHCTHTNINNETQVLLLRNRDYSAVRLNRRAEGLGGDDDVWAELPASAACWRMLKLDENFEFLIFVESKYSIGYGDIYDVTQMASNMKTTIILQNKSFMMSYSNGSSFGIYAVARYLDRVFIGPFNVDEKDNIVLLKQKQVVHDNLIWMYKKVKVIDVIDITEDAEELDPNLVWMDDLMENFLCEPFTSEALKQVPKKVNRYIATNIPYFGHFKAYQRDSGEIIVYWPANDEAYMFPNVTFAKHSLVQLLSQNFIPVPSSFKINVVIMTNLDPVNEVQISKKFFNQSESYVCGDFGIYKQEEVPDEILFKYGEKSINNFISLKERSNKNIERLVHLFGLYFMTNKELRNCTSADTSMVDVLNWAASRIYCLERLHENYVSQEQDLKKMISIKSKRIKQLNSSLESTKLYSLLKAERSGQAKKEVDTIEISDSDDDPSQKPAKKQSPVVIKRTIRSASNLQGDKSRSLLKINQTRGPGPMFKVTNSSPVSDVDDVCIALSD